MNNSIKAASSLEDYKILENLARIIWHEHYSDIISFAQIEYMLEKYQSQNAIENQVEKENYTYYIYYDNDKPVAYCGIQQESSESFYLSKLYVLKQSRKKGIAKKLINHFIKDMNLHQNCKVWLTVNKQNENSINAYKKLGFFIKDDIKTNIGNDFYMDDYLMVLSI